MSIACDKKIAFDVDIKNGFSIDYRENLTGNYVFDNTIHSNNFFIIQLIDSGNATLCVTGKNIPVKKGFIQVIRKSEFLSFHIPKGEKASFYYLSFKEDKISTDIYRRLTFCKDEIRCNLSEKTFEHFISLFQILQGAYINWNSSSEEIIKSVIQTLLVLLLNNHIEDNEQEYNYIVKKALLYIEKHYLEHDFSLAKVSEKVNISPNYLGKLIKKNVGVSFSRYCTWRKLSYSIELLENGMFSIAEIAKKSGFNSPSYYISIFKKHYGVTPQQFMHNKI